MPMSQQAVAGVYDVVALLGKPVGGPSAASGRSQDQEMQAFELDLMSEEAAVSPADPRRMRDADYKEASRRAKEISAARRAERQLASPTRGRPATPRAGPSA